MPRGSHPRGPIHLSPGVIVVGSASAADVAHPVRPACAVPVEAVDRAAGRDPDLDRAAVVIARDPDRAVVAMADDVAHPKSAGQVGVSVPSGDPLPTRGRGDPDPLVADLVAAADGSAGAQVDGRTAQAGLPEADLTVVKSLGPDVAGRGALGEDGLGDREDGDGRWRGPRGRIAWTCGECGSGWSCLVLLLGSLRGVPRVCRGRTKGSTGRANGARGQRVPRKTAPR